MSNVGLSRLVNPLEALVLEKKLRSIYTIVLYMRAHHLAAESHRLRVLPVGTVEHRHMRMLDSVYNMLKYLEYLKLSLF